MDLRLPAGLVQDSEKKIEAAVEHQAARGGADWTEKHVLLVCGNPCSHTDALCNFRQKRALPVKTRRGDGAYYIMHPMSSL